MESELSDGFDVSTPDLDDDDTDAGDLFASFGMDLDDLSDDDNF